MDRRYLHQRQVIGGPECDAGIRHWTEITLPVDELLGMLGCGSGSRLIGARFVDGADVVLTVDEHLEAPCPLADGGDSRSG